MKLLLVVLAMVAGIYLTFGVVVAVDHNNDIVIVRFTTGHKYAFYGAEGWQVGDMLMLFMNSMNTDDPTDDEIVRVWHVGYTK